MPGSLKIVEIDLICRHIVILQPALSFIESRNRSRRYDDYLAALGCIRADVIEQRLSWRIATRSKRAVNVVNLNAHALGSDPTTPIFSGFQNS